MYYRLKSNNGRKFLQTQFAELITVNKYSVLSIYYTVPTQKCDRLPVYCKLALFRYTLTAKLPVFTKTLSNSKRIGLEKKILGPSM